MTQSVLSRAAFLKAREGLHMIESIDELEPLVEKYQCLSGFCGFRVVVLTEVFQEQCDLPFALSRILCQDARVVVIVRLTLDRWGEKHKEEEEEQFPRSYWRLQSLPEDLQQAKRALQNPKLK